MPVHKRGGDSSASPHSPVPALEEEIPDGNNRGCDNHEQERLVDMSESEGSSTCSTENGENDEYIVVKLAEVRKEVQCPICLGIIRKTRTVMECLHRFCRECIDKSMRLGNNECPACRTHCASRRSLRDDPNYDALISALYPDIDKYEEEELIFNEEENARNEKIQAVIAQTFRRQADALGKRRASVRATATCSKRHSSYHKTRGRRNHHPIGRSESDEEEGVTGNDGNRDSSSADEHSPEPRSGRSKRGSSRTSVNADGVCDDNDLELYRQVLGAWGRHGPRRKNRHGGHSWTNGKISRHIRMAKLINNLQSANINGDASKISLTLISLDMNMPTLKRPYVCCSTASSVRHLAQFVAIQTSIEANEIQMLIVKDMHPINISNNFKEQLPLSDLNSSALHLPKEHETLEEIRARLMLPALVLGYMRSPQTAA